MKIALICDTHLSGSTNSPQYHYLSAAIQQIKSDGIQTVVTLGDISAYGEWEAFERYNTLLSGLTHYMLLGNSDVRDPQTEEMWISAVSNCKLHFGGKTLLGISNPYGKITPNDRIEIETLHDGDILVMHHGIRALDEDSSIFLKDLAQKKQLTIINGHHHRFQDEYMSNIRMISLRALDPDKAIGNYPTVTYLSFSAKGIELEEKFISLPLDVIQDAAKHFGISCVDNQRDVAYALENNIYGIELRCNGGDWTPDISLLPQLQEWKNKTNGYLSIHMPNIRWQNETIVGLTQWNQAAEYSLTIGANGMTIHPPRVSRKEMYPGSPAWNALLKIYADTILRAPKEVNIGIENLHLSPGEPDDSNAQFGCNPQEVSAWIQALNTVLKTPGRVGHTLDVGHARNNGRIAQKYPISRWYEIMGDKTVAYHIHQVVNGDSGMRNHQPIEHWFGPMISYVSFFHCWGSGVINKKPIFLEVKGAENYKKSIAAFQKDFL